MKKNRREYLYYCTKCKILEYSAHECSEVKCSECNNDLMPLYVSEYEWDNMTQKDIKLLLANAKKTSLVKKSPNTDEKKNKKKGRNEQQQLVKKKAKLKDSTNGDLRKNTSKRKYVVASTLAGIAASIIIVAALINPANSNHQDIIYSEDTENITENDNEIFDSDNSSIDELNIISSSIEGDDKPTEAQPESNSSNEEKSEYKSKSTDSSKKSEVFSENNDNQPEEKTPPEIDKNGNFCITYLNVEQGDSAYIECDNQVMLIDGGKPGQSSKIYSFLDKKENSFIDVMIATHPDEDHIGGLSGAVQHSNIGVCYSPFADFPEKKEFNSLVKKLAEKNTSITVPGTEERFMLGSAEVTLYCPIKDSDDTNNSSIVTKIVYGNTSFIFMGDAEQEEENALVNSGADIKADVIKIGHHGSKSSSSDKLLDKVSPQYAVISVGDNSYNHPSDIVLTKLYNRNIKTFRTDDNKKTIDVICESDGTNITWNVSETIIIPIENNDTKVNSSVDIDQGFGIGTAAIVEEPNAEDAIDSLLEDAFNDYEEESEDEGPLVWLSASGDCYHSINNCGKMNPDKAIQVTLQEAERRGKGRCSNCW